MELLTLNRKVLALKDDIRDWNIRQKERLILRYNELGFKASGNWEKDLTPTQDVMPFNIRIRMEGSDYTYYMINGRKAGGKFPPVGKIRQWIKDKGITPTGNITINQLTYLISRKIAVEGITPSPERKRLLLDVYDRQSKEELFDLIRKNMIFDIQDKLKKIL